LSPSPLRQAAPERTSRAEAISRRDSASITAVSWTRGSFDTLQTSFSALRWTMSGESRIRHLCSITSPEASMDLLPRARWMSLSGSWGLRSANHSAAMQCQRTRSSSEAVASMASLVSGISRTSPRLPNLRMGAAREGISVLMTSDSIRHSHPRTSLSSGSSADSSSAEHPSTPPLRNMPVTSSPLDSAPFLIREASSIPLGVRK